MSNFGLFPAIFDGAAAPNGRVRYVPTSHDLFGHDSVSGLGYDWSRVADPGIAPRPPFKVYLPRTTADVVRLVREASDAGEQVVVRGHAHSSNNLVTPDGGVVMLTEGMNRIVHLDEADMTVTVQCGAALMALDAWLSELGLGLPIVGDHDHITAAGFASVGGISPASHRHGMFVDTVVELEYVDWAGKVHRCSRQHSRPELLRLLAGTGRHGVITELTITVIKADKYHTVYANQRRITASLDEFVSYSGRMIGDPGDAVAKRGVWADLEVPGLSGASVRLGQFSSYHHTPQHLAKSLWKRLAYRYQNLLGYWAGRLPPQLDEFVKYLGTGTIMLSPGYATMKDIERSTDQVLDSTVGDPTRMFVVLAPVQRYTSLFHQLYELCLLERRRSRAITSISIYVKAVSSAYLSGGDPPDRYVEVMLYLGLRPERMTPEVLDRLVRKIDEITIAHQAVRYMHSLTSSDPTVRAKVDPNTRYSGSSADAPALAAPPAARQVTARAGRPPKGAPASAGE